MFSENIKKQRALRGISQRELGDLVGVTQQAVGRWETGQSLPDTGTLIQLADLFDITTDQLLGRTPRPNSDSVFQQIGNDLFPKLLSQIEQMDIPFEMKQAALKKFHSLTDQEKHGLLPKLVKSAIVEEGKVKYEVDSSFDDEVIQKYKSLPEQDQKAVAAIIDSLASKQK